MRTSLIASVFAFAVSLVAAQEPYYNITSAPFSLILQSKNKTLDGKALYACHEGAAIEGLCIGGKPTRSSKVFHFNTTVYDRKGPGLLTWKLVGGNFVLSEAMEITTNLISNVAIPLFMPSQYVATMHSEEYLE